MVHATAATPPTGLARASLLFLVLYFLLVGVSRPLLHPYEYSDFVSFYAAAGAFAAGSSPYREASLRSMNPTEFSGWLGRYLYPPPFAAVYVRLLHRLPFPVARGLWVVLESLAYLLAGVLLVRATTTRWNPGNLLLAAFLFLSFAPFQFDLRLGSVSGHLLLLCSLFLLARRQGWETLAGVALGTAILLKLSPGLLLFVLALRGEWRLVGRTLAACLFLLLLSLPWTGWDVYVEYVRDVVPRLAMGNYSWFSNQSLDALFWRLFVPNPDTAPWTDSPLLYALLTATTSCAVLVLLARVAWKERQRPPGADCAPALALLAAAILARITWEYMVVLALPCFLQGFQAWRRVSMGPWSRAGFLLAFGLCALPIPYTREPLRSGAGLLLMSPRLYGMLLAFGVVAVAALRSVERGRFSAEEPVGS